MVPSQCYVQKLALTNCIVLVHMSVPFLILKSLFADGTVLIYVKQVSRKVKAKRNLGKLAVKD